MDERFVEQAREVRVWRRRTELDRLTYRRRLVALAPLGSQRELAQVLGMSQPNLSNLLKTAASAPAVAPGFSGASPYEVAERYSVGELSLGQLVDELLRWEYLESNETDGYDDLLVTVPGSFDDVERARDEGLIDGETYDFVLKAGAAVEARLEAAGEPLRGLTEEESRVAVSAFLAARGEALGQAA